MVLEKILGEQIKKWFEEAELVEYKLNEGNGGYVKIELTFDLAMKLPQHIPPASSSIQTQPVEQLQPQPRKPAVKQKAANEPRPY